MTINIKNFIIVNLAGSREHHSTHSFPTRRSSDLEILKRVPASSVERVELIRGGAPGIDMEGRSVRSEEHTSELQSRGQLVCRPLLEKKTIVVRRINATTSALMTLNRKKFINGK